MANTKVAELGHKALGLTDADVLAMYRQMLLARAVDERMWVLNRAGRIPFVISGQGHEGAQVGIAWAFQKGHDWIAPFYRSIATCLTFGMSARDIMTAQYRVAKRPHGRVLVDYNQNAWGRTLASVYSVRPTKAASVSTPVTWDEIRRGITSEQFTMDVVLKRVARHGDLFAPVLNGKVKIPT